MKNSAQTTTKICWFASQIIITDSQVRTFFPKVHSSDVAMREELRSGHSSDLNQNTLR